MSNTLRLNLRDVFKGIVTAVIASVLVFLYNAVNQGGLQNIDWNQLTQIAVSSGLGYLIKNFISDEDGKILGKV